MTIEPNNRTTSKLRAIWRAAVRLLSWAPEVLFVSAALPIMIYTWHVMQNVNMMSLDTKDSLDLTRNAILLLGVLGGGYGLYIAAMRQKTFSKQIKTQIEQAATAHAHLFNEQLGQGVEFMTNNNGAIRRAGLRILRNLAKNTEQDKEKLIMDMVNDFVGVKTPPAPPTSNSEVS